MNNFWIKCINLLTQVTRQPDNVVADVQRSTENNLLFIIVPKQSCIMYSSVFRVLAVFVSFCRCITKMSLFKLRSVSSQVKGHRRITGRPSPRHRWSRPRSRSLSRGKAKRETSHQKGRTSLSVPHRALSELTSLKRCLNFDSCSVSFRYRTI